VFGARAARAAVAEPGPVVRAAMIADPKIGGVPVVSSDSREALWLCAGIERDEEGLRSLQSNLNPLVRLIASCALTRTESRGAHQRRDYPQLDPGLDGCHVTVTKPSRLTVQKWE
jgi:L-aspartate oxidase